MSQEQIGDWFDKADAAIERISIGRAYDQRNRRSLLWIHASIAVLVGILMLGFGGPSQLENTFGLWCRPVLGFFAIIGGLFLAYGLVGKRGRRLLWAEMVGLAMLFFWDLGMTTGMVIARIKGWYPILHFLEPIPDGGAVPYPIFLYGGLGAMILVHSLTLLRIVKVYSWIL